MALQVKICLIEGCDGLILKDVTGPYSEDNLTGYGSENGIEGPEDFDSYDLSVWNPVTPSTEDPTYTQNLLLNIPAPDEDGYYSFQTTLVTDPSGVWYASVAGTTDSTAYPAAAKAILTKDVRTTMVNPAMAALDIDCGCAKGCEDPLRLFALLLALENNGICDLAKAQTDIDWIYDNSPCC